MFQKVKLFCNDSIFLICFKSLNLDSESGSRWPLNPDPKHCNFQEIMVGHTADVWALATSPSSPQFISAGHDRWA